MALHQKDRITAMHLSCSHDLPLERKFTKCRCHVVMIQDWIQESDVGPPPSSKTLETRSFDPMAEHFLYIPTSFSYSLNSCLATIVIPIPRPLCI